MNAARIAELLDPFLHAPIESANDSEVPRHSGAAKAGEEPAVLSPAQLQHISTYIDILLHWNARINLTAIRDPEDIVTRHFGESLFAARHLFPGGTAAVQGRVAGQEEMGALAPGAVSVADIGSGAGFPGLPLKLWSPRISLTLIESNHKKAAFLREVTRALTLTDINVQNARAETLGATFDVVTLRAVEHFEVILPTAATLLAPSGRLALLIGTAQQDQVRSILPHLAWSAPSPIPNSRSRVLRIGRTIPVAADSRR
jgi:16S rRNA (guanine527-N7)-methyltransferase